MDEQKNESLDEWMIGGMKEWMNEGMNEWMNEWMNEGMNEFIFPSILFSKKNIAAHFNQLLINDFTYL